MEKEKGNAIANALTKIIEEYSNKAGVIDCLVGIVSAATNYLSFIKKTIDDDDDLVERKFLDILKVSDDIYNMNFDEYINTNGLHKVREEIMLDTVVRLMGMMRRGLINPITKNIEIMRMLNKTNEKAS
jgi:hypothetical protein